jgi:hypothetical protein
MWENLENDAGVRRSNALPFVSGLWRRAGIPAVYAAALPRGHRGIALPFLPLAATANPLVAKVGILPLVTPVLAYAGLSLAKDLPVLKTLGWRIIVVSLLANAGAFLAGEK